MLWGHPRTTLQCRRSTSQAEPFDPSLPFRIQSLGRLELDPVAHVQLYRLRSRNVFLDIIRPGRAGRVAQRGDP